MIYAKKAIVWVLIHACELQDALRLDHLTHTHILATWSAELDEHWDTGIWKAVEV